MSATYTIGVDEVGTGALAGPAYICAVVTPHDWDRPVGLRDSKKMSEDQRHKIYGTLLTSVKAFRIVSIPSMYIDRFGLRKAWSDAISLALRELTRQFPSYELIVDGNELPTGWQGRAIPRADSTEPSVSAASVIAKVNRDNFMGKLDAEFPYYDWKQNVGYGTRTHWMGIHKYGVSPLHRASYGRLKELVAAGKVLGAGRLPK